MKSQLRKLASLGLCLFVTAAVAQVTNPVIERQVLGSGQPGVAGFENSTLVDNNVFHSPQYLPQHPTAATIWPRVVTVPCRAEAGGLRCDGYVWTPKLGRAEYLFFQPVIVKAPEPVVLKPPLIVREVREVEVERKKIRQ